MILGASDVNSHVEECRPAVVAPAVGAAIYRWNFPGPRFTTRIICLILSVDLAEVEPVTSSDFRGSLAAAGWPSIVDSSRDSGHSVVGFV